VAQVVEHLPKQAQDPDFKPQYLQNFKKVDSVIEKEDCYIQKGKYEFRTNLLFYNEDRKWPQFT
jgi:beta-galactosidase beta subunit